MKEGIYIYIYIYIYNEVFLRVTNHTGQAEKNLLGPAGIFPPEFTVP